jgi:hypothetical protein
VPRGGAAALNEKLAGTTYPSVRFEVEAERVRAFAAAVGAEPPGSAVTRVPSTFATAPEVEAMAQIIRDPVLALDFTRVIHAEQSYEWHRPLRIGDVLTVVPSIDSIRAKAGSEILVVATEMRDHGGQMVVSARCTLVVRPPDRGSPS